MSGLFDQTIQFLRRRLSSDLPGPQAQIKMAPSRAGSAERVRVEGRDCREAGVLALLYPRMNEPHLLVTVRRAHLTQHAGQISFPGGRREPDEALLQTALRETHEEVGLDPSHIEVIGALSPLYIPPSNYCVYPFLGFTQDDPDLIPHDVEVERVEHVPLRCFLEEENLREEDWTIRGELLRVPFFKVEGLTIWGATAMMISEIVALFDEPDSGSQTSAEDENGIR